MELGGKRIAGNPLEAGASYRSVADDAIEAVVLSANDLAREQGLLTSSLPALAAGACFKIRQRPYPEQASCRFERVGALTHVGGGPGSTLGAVRIGGQA